MRPEIRHHISGSSEEGGCMLPARGAGYPVRFWTAEAEELVTPTRLRSSDAVQVRQRQEREAVREAEGKGHVEVARCPHRQQSRCLEPRRQEIRVGLQPSARWHHCAEEESGCQRGQGGRAQEVSPGRRPVWACG